MRSTLTLYFSRGVFQRNDVRAHVIHAADTHGSASERRFTCLCLRLISQKPRSKPTNTQCRRACVFRMIRIAWWSVRKKLRMSCWGERVSTHRLARTPCPQENFSGEAFLYHDNRCYSFKSKRCRSGLSEYHCPVQASNMVRQPGFKYDSPVKNLREHALKTKRFLLCCTRTAHLRQKGDAFTPM